MSGTHASLLNRLAAAIAAHHPRRIIRIAIDGIDGAGKTTLADALAPLVCARARHVIRASVDDFHHPRAIRYARGRSSPDGFYRDSYDYAAFRRLLLDPLVSECSGRYVVKAFDHRIDASVDCEALQAPPNAALIVDGIFLHRPELRDFWDLSIFLKVDFTVSIPRGARRGPDFGSPQVDAPSNRRYVEGQKLYLAECAPAQRADIVIGYDDLREPQVLKWDVALPSSESRIRSGR